MRAELCAIPRWAKRVDDILPFRSNIYREARIFLTLDIGKAAIVK
jgi:hypothetical protein